jgi:hypothetical protein
MVRTRTILIVVILVTIAVSTDLLGDSLGFSSVLPAENLILEELPAGYFFAFDVMSDGVSIIASSGLNGTLYESMDDGLTWELLWSHPRSSEVSAGQMVFVDSRDYIFAKFTAVSNYTESELLWRSIDDGLTFSVVFSTAEVNQPLIGEDSNGNLFIGTYGENAEVWRSSNGGNSWVKVWDDEINAEGNLRHCHGIIVDPETDWVYMMTGGRRGGEAGGASYIIRSKDAGDTWTRILTLEGTVNPIWVPMGLVVHQGKLYFGSDLPNPPDSLDYIYRFEDDGLMGDHNIKAEKVFEVPAWIALWLRVTPMDDYIIGMVGNKFVFSDTGDLGNWTIRELSNGSMMFSHSWTSSGWMFSGSGFSSRNPYRFKIEVSSNQIPMLIVSTLKNGIPTSSILTLFDENHTVIETSNETSLWMYPIDDNLSAKIYDDITTNLSRSPGWAQLPEAEKLRLINEDFRSAIRGIYYVQATIIYNDYRYQSEKIEVALTLNTELAIDFLFSNLTVSCLDVNDLPMENCQVTFTREDEERVLNSDSSGLTSLEAFYGNWTVEAYWMDIPVGEDHITVDNYQTALNLQCSVGDLTVIAVDPSGNPVEADVTITNETYSLAQSIQYHKAQGNLTFHQIPLIQYDLAISGDFDTQIYQVDVGQTKKIQIEILPLFDNVPLIIMGVVICITIAILGRKMLLKRPKETTITDFTR